MQYLLSVEEYEKLAQNKEAFERRVKEAVTVEIAKRSDVFKLALYKYIKAFIPDYGTIEGGFENSKLERFIKGLHPIFKMLESGGT